jgi:hypothetical protein
MFWSRSPGDIVRAWEGEIETQLELGARPLLSLGYNDAATHNLAALLALAALATKRRDVTAPVMPVGGSGLLWAAALLRPDRAVVAGPPEIAVRFSGADLATETASLLLYEHGRHSGAPLEIGLPPVAMRRWFAPQTQAGADAPWEAMPFVAQPHDAPTPGGQSHWFGTDWIGTDWIGWAAILAASALVLAAILF